MIDPIQCDFSNTPVSPKRPTFRYALVPNLYAEPSVTVITPFYNTGAIFNETARSVLQQSFQQWEWLIINDGSTEKKSVRILNEYRNRDTRIRVIDHSTNRGLSAARNTGFREANTKYVVQLDSDDLLEPTAVEKWFWFLESHPEYSFVKGYSVNFAAKENLWLLGFHNGRAFLDGNKANATCMIRKKVHEAVGGYDETIRGGLEDWDFWLRCASFGFWGSTVPEYLDWYRRRAVVKEKWPNWHNGSRRADFHAELRRRYSKLWKGGFPRIQIRRHIPTDSIQDELPCENLLSKDKRRILMILPSLTAGCTADFDLNFASKRNSEGFEITIATTLNGDHSRLPEFTKHTPDVFALHRFLKIVDYPRFLRYLMRSRQVDMIMISHSEIGYELLPYLRAHFPNASFIDHTQDGWKNRGYACKSLRHRELLDLNIVSSKYLKNWLVSRGGDPQKIQVGDTKLDPSEWRYDPKGKHRVREKRELEVPILFYSRHISQQRELRISNWRVRLFYLLQPLYPPFYHWGIKHNVPWYFPLVARIKLALLSLR